MAAPQMAPQKIKPGIAGIIIGIVLIFAGIGGCIASFIVPIAGVVGQVTDVIESASGGNRVESGTSQTFNLTDVDNVWIFGVGSTESDATQVLVSVTDSSGAALPCSELSSGTNASGEAGGRAFSFECAIELKGKSEITVSADGPPGTQAALVTVSVSVGQIGAFILGGLAAGVLLPLIGLILIIVTAVRRSKAKKARAGMGMPMGGPPMGAPGMAPPPPGAGMPPMGAPGMAPPPPMGAPGAAPPPPMGAPGAAPPPPMGAPGAAPPPPMGAPGMAPPPPAVPQTPTWDPQTPPPPPPAQ